MTNPGDDRAPESAPDDAPDVGPDEHNPLVEDLVGPRPRAPADLRAWLRAQLGLTVADRPIVEGAASPFDYLCHSFFEPPAFAPPGSPQATAPRDCVVWANRGGGKTFYAAVATLLDLLFKPGIEVRILGGSLEQSKRMHSHLRMLLESSDSGLAALIEGKVMERRVRLVNGSQAELLAQSQTSVRGTRVQRLRCDEVELFHPDVWEAAQLTTRSKRCGDVWVTGSIECLSTMHRPHGLMWTLVSDQPQHRASRRVFRWGVLDVLDRCGPQHGCDSCALRPECDGRAKARDAAGHDAGHVSVDDASRLKLRVSDATWRAEMLCLEPSRDDCVLPEFDDAVHVVDAARPVHAALPVDGAKTADTPTDDHTAQDIASSIVCGIDFGIRAPTVVLWARVDRAPPDQASTGGRATPRVTVLAERVVAGVTLAEHIAAIDTHTLGKPAWVGIDPAGRARSLQTGRSEAQALREAGLVVRARRLGLFEGLDLLRRRLKPATGAPTLFIDRSCRELIKALTSYHYAERGGDETGPVKDGSDHAVDALRYLVQNLDREFRTVCGGY